MSLRTTTAKSRSAGRRDFTSDLRLLRIAALALPVGAAS